MNAIHLKGNEGYIKFVDLNVEIKSRNFFATGKIDIDSDFLINLRKGFEECINCETKNFSKSLVSTNNKLFGIEMRTDCENESVLLLGIYREEEINGNILDFDLIVSKDEIKKIIEELTLYALK